MSLAQITNDQLVNALMDAQAVNSRQDAVLFDPSPEIDSALEHVLAIAQTASPDQRPHVKALIHYLGEARHLNHLERGYEQAAAAVADPITSVHDFAKTVRPLLADLLNPLMGGPRRDRTVADLQTLFGRTLPRTRRAFSLRPLLGVNKFTELVIRLDEWEADTATGIGASLTVDSLGVEA